MTEGEEIIDIYDENRVKTGVTKPRHGEGSGLKPDEFMIYVLALLEDRNGRFLITRRTLDKKWAPGQWEIPGGGARAGETSNQAIAREVREETGLDISSIKPISVYTYINRDAESGDNYFCDIYHFKIDYEDRSVTVQESEVLGWKRAGISEINDIAKGEGFLHLERITQALAAEKN